MSPSLSSNHEVLSTSAPFLDGSTRMIPLLIGIFLIILFIVTLVLSASTWRGWHIAVAALAFLATLGLIVVGSLSQKTHSTWMKKYAELDSRLTQARQEGINLEIGDPTVVESPTPSVNDIQQQFNRLLLDRGRVWRQCAPSPPSGTSVVVSTVPPTETGQPGDPNTAQPNGIDANMVLYAFRENEKQLPIAFLGEFRVTQAEPASVTLEPTMPLDRPQLEVINNPSSYWTLYEMMPLDSHRIFSNQDIIDEPLDDTPKPIFGEMDGEELRGIFSLVSGVAPDDPFVMALVAPYVKDGSSANDQEVNMYPENIWQKLEFEKDHKERVDSNNLDPGISGNFFDPEGYAEVSQLKSGGEATFRVNDIGVFPYGFDEDKRLVDQLTSSGVCQKLGPVFVRSLHDYEEAFHNIQDRFVKRNEDKRRTQRELDDLNASISKTTQQIEYRQQERSELKEDQAGFNRDLEKTNELLAALETQQTMLRAELSELFQTNLALSQQLAIYNARLTEEINRRAENVALQTP